MSLDKKTWRAATMSLAIILGIGVAILSGLETKVDWIATLCGFLGNGCKDAVEYRLFGIPISFWGIGYYLFLATLYLGKRSWLFFGVVAGVGVEVALIKIMVEMKFLCLLCAANFLLMLILFIALFDRRRLYEMASAILLFFILTGSLVSNSTDAVHNSLGEPSSVIATAAGREITVGEMKRALTTQLHQVEKATYQFKTIYLESRINEILLENEAIKKETTIEGLKALIGSETPDPAEALVDYYYVTKKYQKLGRWTGSEQEIKEQIKAYLHDRDVKKSLQIYYRQLWDKYPVSVFLQEPPLPLANLSLEGCPSLGPDHAPVTIVELSDYLCPICRKEHALVQQIRKKYEGRIRWVFKDYPLEMHRGAKELALAARCAHEQGRFWEYQEFLFAKDKRPDSEEIALYAEEVGLNMPQFTECMSAPDLRIELEKEIAEAKQAGITTTPSFIINGRLHTGMPSLEKFSAMIDEALEEAAETH